ncbi:hypothetical protein GUITHDRAFT_116679 [Guillardia theta CCMP2712]|uniref:Uncharacterized protein n=1 Tax=Guillardia theta (strain CCMP2712) TaxID=905079 RepID=L1ILV2_GUITC|nr:hypothetical protein GUITHDRAFT_116679 [Guillardia theta CCMP2712]EKX37102.1 hypothetical protein GUITHDRAFT_116679 [Guillardia theta CCMP2712]|eukprot:XP_005824082.1 hypothetical protein GUITHDRAFT_116679 [Guillardia theta CCMP2712]
MPHCPYSAVPDPACIPGFTGFSCYPYCMGIHLKGSINQGIVLYGANDWRDSVQYILRDCGVGQSTAGGLVAGLQSNANARFTASWDPASQSCVNSGGGRGSKSCESQTQPVLRRGAEQLPFSIVIGSDSSYGRVRVWKMNAFALDQSQTTAANVMTWTFEGFSGDQTLQNSVTGKGPGVQCCLLK